MDNEKKVNEQTEAKSAEVHAEKKFAWNKQYLTICMYAVLVVFASVIIVKSVMSWSSLMTRVSKFFSVIAPFIWGAFIAFLINPLVNTFDRGVWNRIKPIRKKPGLKKFLSLFFAYLLAFGVIVLMFVFVIPQLTNSVVDLVSQTQDWIANSDEWILELEAKFPQLNYDNINAILLQYQPQLIEFSKNIVTNVVPMLFSTGVSFVKVLMNMIIAIMVSFYMISDKKLMRKNFRKFCYAVFPTRTVKAGSLVLHESYRIFSSFIYGKAVDSLIIGLLCFAVTSVFEVPYALLISLIVGVTNMIPYFGPFIGAVPSAIIVLISSPIKALVFIIIIIVLQQLDGIVIGPKILGDSVGLRPIWIIFAITVGGSVGGVIGMFLGVPVTAVIVYLLDMLTDSLMAKKNLSEKSFDE